MFDTVKMKKFIGTEKISARRMRQDSVSFTPSHTLVVNTNYRPVVADTDQFRLRFRFGLMRGAQR